MQYDTSKRNVINGFFVSSFSMSLTPLLWPQQSTLSSCRAVPSSTRRVTLCSRSQLRAAMTNTNLPLSRILNYIIPTSWHLTWCLLTSWLSEPTNKTQGQHCHWVYIHVDGTISFDHHLCFHLVKSRILHLLHPPTITIPKKAKKSRSGISYHTGGKCLFLFLVGYISMRGRKIVPTFFTG